MLAVPFSMIGAVWLLFLLHYSVSVAVWVGLIALAGLDAETGVVMLLYLTLAHDRHAHDGKLRSLSDLRASIVEGAAKRLRPKLMTVATMIIGLVPILSSTGTGADVMKRIAAPMVGGLVTSFLLELTVYPAIFGILEGRGLRQPMKPCHAAALDDAADLRPPRPCAAVQAIHLADPGERGGHLHGRTIGLAAGAVARAPVDRVLVGTRERSQQGGRGEIGDREPPPDEVGLAGDALGLEPLDAGGDRVARLRHTGRAHAQLAPEDPSQHRKTAPDDACLSRGRVDRPESNDALGVVEDRAVRVPDHVRADVVEARLDGQRGLALGRIGGQKREVE